MSNHMMEVIYSIK